MGVGPQRDGDEPSSSPPPPQERRGDGPPAPSLTPRLRILAGVIVGVSYTVSFVLRDETLPGIVGGALAGLLTVLLLREIEARRRRRDR